MNFLVMFLFFLLLQHRINCLHQLNLYYTDDRYQNDYEPNNCLRLIEVEENEGSIFSDISSFCLSGLLPSSSQLISANDYIVSNFTFMELSQQDITSSQLYYWLAPIDIVERYQSYLDNLLLLNNDQDISNEVFYNCTWPRFGTKCQYEFDFEISQDSSFSKVVRDFYRTHPYSPTTLTCYVHLNCDRGPDSTCLDWTEICNGELNCLNGNFDEEYCWQLEMNKCNEDEFQCRTGQCISKSFFNCSC